VRLANFNPDNYDESLLWTESCDLGKDFGYIRMVHDISLGLDAIRADGVQMPVTDITTFVLSKRAESDTQSWKILYWDDEANATCGGLYTMPTCRIYNKAARARSPRRCCLPRAQQPCRQVPALDQGHEVRKQNQGRGRLSRIRSHQQIQWRGHQVLLRYQTDPH
jgi:hypothetical protein